jgi:hypothetical protein
MHEWTLKIKSQIDAFANKLMYICITNVGKAFNLFAIILFITQNCGLFLWMLQKALTDKKA